MSPPFLPCIPTRATEPPIAGRWIHEVKHDGYRLIARCEGNRVVLRTRGGFNWADRYPRIVRSVLALRISSIVLDGEVAYITREGISDFDALHTGRNDEWTSLLAFDLLEVGGSDMRELPLLERKRRLKKLLSTRDDGIQFVDHLVGNGANIFEHACRMGPEGIVSKRADSPYRAGRSKNWLKVKNPSHPSIARIRDTIDSGSFRSR
jgi:bifunctional non-homologous end joining protein LigD